LNRSSFAFFVALLIHLLFLLLFWLLGSFAPQIPIKEKPQEKKIKVSLKELPKKSKESGLTKKKVKPPEIAPPMPKGSQLKKIIKKPLVKLEPKPKTKEPKLNPKPKPKPKVTKPKPKPKVTKPKPKLNPKPKVTKPKPKVEPLPPQEPYIPLLAAPKEHNITKKPPKPKKKKKESSLYAMLSQDKSAQENDIKEQENQDAGASAGQNIQELYGEEFGKLSQGQQKYIIDNQEVMRRITQQVLTRVARVNLKSNLNVNKSNVIEFYLHPNGDMSDFKFLEKSGYYILDDTTKETIEYAYSRYPRPTEKTLIRYNVFYNLARY